MKLIGIAGKKGSGKDLVGSIIQYLEDKNATPEVSFEFWYSSNMCSSYNQLPGGWEIRKFADKLKDMVCWMIGCTREQLEDRDFKEKELGEEWNIWSVYEGIGAKESLFADKESASKLSMEIWGSYDEPYLKTKKSTPRTFMELLGTECGRDILHPNIWVNSLFADYQPVNPQIRRRGLTSREAYNLIKNTTLNLALPPWIITDVRFENEVKAIKDRKGVVIRVDRLDENGMEHKTLEEHSSETQLDDYDFDYVIENDGTIEELVEKVKKIYNKIQKH